MSPSKNLTWQNSIYGIMYSIGRILYKTLDCTRQKPNSHVEIAFRGLFVGDGQPHNYSVHVGYLFQVIYGRLFCSHNEYTSIYQ